jgi:hypothetical protein
MPQSAAVIAGYALIWQNQIHSWQDGKRGEQLSLCYLPLILSIYIIY